MQGEDERPVGGGSGSMDDDKQPPSFSAQSDATGPLEQRIVSKNWQARKKAFEEIAAMFHMGDQDAVREHCGQWKKYLSDNNPGSLEVCIDALQAFIERGEPRIIQSVQNDILKALIEKCLGHAKPTIKQKGLECFLSIFEATEMFEESFEALVEMLNSKNQKVSQTAMQTFTTLLGTYGIKKIHLKPFIPVFESFAASTVPATKQEALAFYKECYRWLGDGANIQSIIKNLKKQQQDELENAFKDIKAENVKRVARMTRGEKLKAKDMALDEIIRQQEEEDKANDQGLDLFEAVDILAKYGPDWSDKIIEVKNWAEKKALLDQLCDDCNQPKIKAGDYQHLITVIKKLITDSMVQVSLSAIKVCGNLAKGLKKDFESGCKELIVPLLLRFKEKKTQIIDEVVLVLDSFMLCTNIEILRDSLIGVGLSDKAPTVKKSTCAFLEKTVQKTYVDVLQRVSTDYIVQLMKLTEDPDGDVRAASLTCLGVFKGRLGEAALSNYLKDMLPQKLAKVTESSKQVQPSKYDRPEKKEEPVQAPPKGGAGKAPVKKQPPKQVGAAAEEQPLEVKAPAKKPAPKTQEPDDIPIAPPKRPANNFDDLPIGGKPPAVQFDPEAGEDIPIPKGAYNLDNLGPEAFGGDSVMTMENKPKRAPPARFANKSVKKEEEKKEEPQPELQKESSKEEIQPQETPVKKYAPSIDDQPIGGSKNVEMITPDEEDKPLPKGQYNLDSLGADAFGDPNMMAQPKKQPPARFAEKSKPKIENIEEKPLAKPNLDDVPIGGIKPAVTEADLDEDKPLPKGAYNLDALGDDAFGGPPPSSAPKKGPPARFAAAKAKLGEVEKPVQKNIDEIPLGGAGKAPVISPDDEDKPLPKGAYNLDALGDDAFGGPPPKSNGPPKKGPPTRVTNPPKKETPSVPLDDVPIGGAKQPPVMADSEMDEDKPLPKGTYNLDALGDDAFGGPPPSSAPKKAPPARIAKKVDEDMKDEEQAAPVKKPPPKKVEEEKKAPAKAAPVKGGAGAAKPGAGAQEEEGGSGLSKEEAEAKVAETFPPEIVAKFEEAKWNDKQEGYKGISAQLAEMNPDAVVIEAVVRFIKIKMKDYKESNINLIKEAIAIFTVIAVQCEKVGKRSVYVMMPFLSDKLGDVKTLASVSELLLSLSEVVTPKYVANQIIKYASQAKSPNVIKESCNTLTRMTEDFGIITMPLKEMIDYAIVAVNNSNPQVRTSAMALFAIMYKHAGETIKNFLKDIKESTMKLIEDECAKVTPYKKGEFVRKRNFKGEAAFDEAAAGAGKKGAGGGGGGLDDLLPRVDISKQLTPKLMPLFKDNDWKKRKEAADKVIEIMKEANMRIQPVGLNELMDCIKQRMKDANKAVLKAYVQLICQVVEALGANAKQFSKKLLPPMLENLSDKQSLVRADVVTAMDKWAEHCGAELIISIGGPLVTLDNPELRTEMLQWIIKNKESIKLVQADSLKEVTKPLVDCLSDKTPAIRNLTEEVICSVMPLTGYPAFQGIISTLKPAVQNTIKPVLEKIKNKCGAGAAPAPPAQQQLSSSLQAPPLTATVAASPQEAPKSSFAAAAAEKKTGPTLKASVVSQEPSGGLKPKITPKEQPAAEAQPKQDMNQSLNGSLAKKAGPSNTPAKGGLMKKEAAPQQPAQTGPRLKASALQQLQAAQQQQPIPLEAPVQEGLVVNFGHKQKRAEYDKKVKFSIEEIKSDQIDKLKMFCVNAIGQAFTTKMFSADFKLHCECIDLFNQLMMNQFDGLIEILDIIFKWSVVRLADSSNTKFAVNMFDFYAALLSHLAEQQYCLCEQEANILIPLLCEKTGINNNLLKDKVKKILKMVYDVYDRQKCYNLIVLHGLNSKSLTATAECLDELSDFILNFGIDYSSEKEMRLAAKMADHNSPTIRENALKLLGEVYKHIDDNIWSVVGQVTPKVQGLLEGRFKKIKGVPVTAAPQTQTLQPSNSQAQLSASYGYKPQNNQAPAQQAVVRKSQLAAPTMNTARPTTGQIKPSSNQKLNSSLSNSLGGAQQQHSSPQQQVMQPRGSLPAQQPMLQQRQIAQTDRSNMSKMQALPKQPPPQTLLQNENDEDEDLRIFEGLDKPSSLFGDGQLDKLFEDITRHVHLLKYADMSKRVDSLVSLSDTISSVTPYNLPVFARAANDIISAFVVVMADTFDKNVEYLNLKFAKYFVSIVLKTCSCKDIMVNVSQEAIFSFAEQLLTKLLIENLDKVGENKEGEQVLKNLNSSILRILENCNHTAVICVLFDLLRKYFDYPEMPKIPNLIIKCLVKISKIIEQLIGNLDLQKILLSIHEYLLVINHENKSVNDENGVKITKTIINELVKIKREDIWEAYTVLKLHRKQDLHIQKWIDLILKSLRTQASSSNLTPGQSTGPSVQQVSPYLDKIIRQIVADLRDTEKFESTLPKLAQILNDNADINLDDYLQQCSLTFQKFIKNNLENYRQQPEAMALSINQPQTMQQQPQQQEEVRRSQFGFGMQRNTIATPQQAAVPTDRITEQQNKLENLQKMKERMSLMKSGQGPLQQRATVGGGEPTPNNNNGGANMNTSFSAMNSSLSQKWINKKSQIVQQPGGLPQQQMSSTMATGFGGQQLQQPAPQMNQSLGLQGRAQEDQQPQGLPKAGAQNQELNQRLAEMKAKLQALKGQRQ